MNLSERPGIGSFVAAGMKKRHKQNGSVAVGYRFGHNWRTEAEYVFKEKTEFTQRLFHFCDAVFNAR